MGDPELHSDEKVLLTTQDVFVKSIPFEAVLTNKRIILLDRKKNLIPQKDILLATVGDITAAENAIRDQTITLSLITSSGETRQLVLTFSRTAGGGRRRERDEWVKTLKELTSSSIQKTIRKVVPSLEPEARKFDTVPKKKVSEQPPSRIEITRQPGVRKEIEGARPMKTSLEPEPPARRMAEPEPPRKSIEPEPIIRKIVEPEYIPPKIPEPEPAVRKIFEPDSLPPKPVETSSLPIGTFCTRCGNRVPPDSVFCNRCGSRVAPGGEQAGPAPEPAVPQVAVESRMPAAAPKIFSGERRERPIEREIQSIEPLIEGSVPRTSEAPPVPPTRPVEPVPEQPRPAPGSESTSIAQAAQSIIDAVTPAAPSPEGAPAATPPEGAAPAAVAQPQPAPAAPPSVPPLPPASPSKWRKIAIIIVGILVILAILSAGFLFWNTISSGDGAGTGETATPTATPTATLTPTWTYVPTTAVPTETTVTAQPTPQVLVPASGVWIRITYPNIYKGTAGLAGSQEEVGGTGDKFYMVATSGGIVEAAVQKVDGSGEELLVRIYKDGELVKSGSTAAPKGTVELQVDLRPVTTTTTAARTTTAAATETSEP